MWVPELGAQARHVPQAADYINAQNISQYWDPTESVGKAYGRLLSTPGSAWDVYFVFPPGMKWNGNVPKPVFWMHQLGGVTNAPRLDANVFASEVRRTRVAHPR